MVAPYERAWFGPEGVPSSRDRCARAIGAVEPVVPVRAQAAKLAQPERGEVAAMRLEMVGDGRWRDEAQERFRSSAAPD